jgi:hypothetical protein
MTMEMAYTLLDVIDEALVITNSGPTRLVINWILLNRQSVLDDNRLTLYGEALGNMIRTRRKKKEKDPATDHTHSLCFDFGLKELDLPDEISVPSDMNNLPYCACDWPQLDDATIDDLDKHLALLDAQIELDMTSRANIRRLRQVAAQVVPGRTDIPLRELREIARNGRDAE